MIVAQLTGLAAVHAHPVAVVTPTVPVIPAAGAFALMVEMVAAQDVPACVTVTGYPASVRATLRVAVDEFGLMV